MCQFGLTFLLCESCPLLKRSRKDYVGPALHIFEAASHNQLTTKKRYDHVCDSTTPKHAVAKTSCTRHRDSKHRRFTRRAVSYGELGDICCDVK